MRHIGKLPAIGYTSPCLKRHGFDDLTEFAATSRTRNVCGFLVGAPVLAALMGGLRPCWLSLREFPSSSTRQRCRPHLTMRGSFDLGTHLEPLMAHTLASTDASAVVLATPELTTVNGQVTTTSQQIAEHFGKTHKSVLRSIRNLGAEMPAETYRRNFAPIQIGVDLGMGRIRQDPAYRITRDGFALLAMGFTGKEALHWKLAYIEAFNRMESALLAPAAPIQAAQPALDYTRISPAQRQHLKELVDLVVESGRQKTHGETWTRFHRKMKVNKYELLPASQFDEACAYLHGKMDDTSMAVLIQKHFPGGVMAALQLQAAPKKYHFPLEAADPHGRQFGNAWLTPRVLLDPKNRPLELELIEQLEKDGHDVMGVKIRILAMRDAMGRAEDARGFLQHVHDRLGPLLENCKVGLMERGKNVQFVGKPNPNSAIDRFVFRDQMGR